MEGDPINYKAHIPAGITFAGLFSLIMGWVAVIPVLIGGAVGGALPDIDTEGAAIEKMGSKSASAAHKTIGKMGSGGKMIARMMAAVGSAVDLIFLAPLGRLWRFLSENIFGRVYLAVYRFGSFGADNKSLGEVLHWNGDSKPWAHRGGITHSFSFMLTSCVFTVPIAFIFQSPEFLLGCELGIVSHLFADSLCKSGVKFFFPFQPKIGFDNENGAGRGRDIRLLPKGMQVSTGKDRLTNAELDNYPDQEKAAKDRRLRFREKMWQWIFKVSALICVVLLVVGFAGRAGGVAFSAPIFGGELVASIELPNMPSNDSQQPSTGEDKASPATNTSENDVPDGNEGEKESDDNIVSASNEVPETGNVSGTQVDIASAGGTLAGVNPYKFDSSSSLTKPEIKGPTSLTRGDLSIKSLPKGIMKMPDETLWVIGVGPVSVANLDNPRWMFTKEEKEMLLRAASAQRFEDIPNSISSIFKDPAGTVDAIAGTAENMANDAQNAASGAAGGLSGWISDATGVDISKGNGYTGGFLGLTDWTDS